MKTSIPIKQKNTIFKKLETANLAFQKCYPGDRPDRQPVHTVYGGANLFKANTAQKMGEVALKSFKEYAPNFVELARVLQLEGWKSLPTKKKKVEELAKNISKSRKKGAKKGIAYLAYQIYQKIESKLISEAIEDFRIDFEDGFGNRSDKEEDDTAVQAAMEVATGMKNESLPPFIGIRIKPFTEDLKQRATRTLDLFLTTLLQQTKGKLPNNFVVMLPKVTIPEQISALVGLFEIIEDKQGLKKGALKMEMMVETTQSVMDSAGINPLKVFVAAAEGRLIATHFGTYDYTASCNITARYQTMAHPVCDFAHHMTKVALAHTGIWLSDGATNVMPVAPHRGAQITKKQKKQNKEVVHNAWKVTYDHIRHSLYNGLYQGWDLHPAQLPMRYAAVYVFFLESYDGAVVRLKHFVDKSAQATLSGDIFDDAATGQGLLNFFLKALNSGAISEEEAMATGLTVDEINTRSFYKILEGRRKQ